MAKETKIKLVRLEIRNFKKVRAGIWEIGPGLNRLTSQGKNRQGKTSVLHAVRTLFEGAGAVPPEPVNSEKKPDDESLVRAWLDNGWSIKRTFTEKGTYLYVEGPEGLRGQQSTISPWIGPGHFNPLGFFNLSSEEQARALLSLSSVEDLEAKLTELERKEDDIYEDRTPWISEQRRLRGIEKPEGERPQPISVQKEMDELGKLQAQEREWQDLEREQRNLAKSMNELNEREEQVQERIKAWRTELERVHAEAERVAKRVTAVTKSLKGRTDIEGRIDQVKARIEKAEAVQEELEPWKEWERAQERLEDVDAAVEERTKAIKETREKRRQLIAEAEFPIEGLDFTPEGEVRLHGHPLEQASGRERIELGVVAAVASDPRLRVILVDEGNDLDEDGIANLAQLAEDENLQLIIARLGLEGAGELEVVDGWGPIPGDPEDADEEEGDDEE